MYCAPVRVIGTRPLRTVELQLHGKGCDLVCINAEGSAEGTTLHVGTKRQGPSIAVGCYSEDTCKKATQPQYRYLNQNPEDASPPNVEEGLTGEVSSRAAVTTRHATRRGRGEHRALVDERSIPNH